MIKQQPTSPRKHNRQAGLTLIELMISMVLGLIIISAVVNVYVGSTRSARFSDGLRAMQENGRHGVAVLQRGIRLAGYTHLPTEILEPFDIASADENTLIVQMRQVFDCNGESTAGTNGIAVNTYQWVETEQHITCRGNSASASDMPLIDDVHGFRVLYGVDEDGDDFSERFVEYEAGIDPRDINAIRFGLLVSSNGPIRSRDVEETHTVLDMEYTTDDRVARRVFAATVLLRNKR